MLSEYLKIYCMSRDKIKEGVTQFKITVINDDTVIFNTLNGDTIGFLSIKQLDGNCGIALIYEVNFYNTVIFPYIISYMEKVCRNCGFSLMMLTLNEEYDELIKLFEYIGYIKSVSFISQRTQNTNYILTKELNES